MLSLFRLALVKIMLENPCTNPMRTSSKSFLVQQFFKNAADETPRAILRKSESFSREGEQKRPPY
jgi:hypothetical protein